MPTESEMYKKVREFVVAHWNANESLTFYDHGEHAEDGQGISLPFGGIRVEPDIYGIISSGAFEIPILGEGKLRMGGFEGTNAVSQALAYRCLGMLAFVFFPEAEFETAAAPHIESLCRQAGIALLKVPPGEEPVRPKHVVIGLPGGDPTTVADIYDKTLTQIKGLGSKNLGHVYPTSLRDFLSLFAQQRNSRDDLYGRFERRWDDFRQVLSQRPYDPMVAKKVSRNTAQLREEYFDRFLNALLSLGLVVYRAGGFALKHWADQVRFVTQPTERFTPTLGEDVARCFAVALLREFDQPLSTLLAAIRTAGHPLSSRSYCRNANCGHQGGWDSRWIDEANDESLRARCPECKRGNVELGLWARQWADAGSWVPTLDYSVVKFASAVGVLSSRRLPSWLSAFPDLPQSMPSGRPIRWNFYWLGRFLDSRPMLSREEDAEEDSDSDEE